MTHSLTKKIAGLLTVLLLSVALASCMNYKRQRGVENTWREVDPGAIVAGETTQKDIVEMLGPPSQIISLKSGPVFYYLSEQVKGGGFVLILFNSLDEKITYDRAVFFFDNDGVLLEYSLSKEAIGDK